MNLTWTISIIMLYLRLCKLKDEGRILVLYSSLLDFDTNGTAEIEMAMKVDKQRLKFVDLKDSSCSEQSTEALKTLIEGDIFGNNDFSSVVGPSCSNSAYAVAKLIKRSGVSVRHLHTAPLPAPLAAEVRDSSEGLLPPVDILADASLALIKHTGWVQVLVLYQSTNLDMLYIFDHFQKQVDEYCKQKLINCDKINLQAFPILGNVDRILKRNSARIIFLMADRETSSRVLSTALELGVLFPAYQWVIVKATVEKTIQSLEKSSCTKLNVSKIIDKALFINYLFEVESNGSFKNYGSVILYSNTIKLAQNGTSNFISDSLFPPKAYIVQSLNSKQTAVSKYGNGSLSHRQGNLIYISSTLTVIFNVVYFPLGVFFIAFNLAIFVTSLSMHILTMLYRKNHSVKVSSVFLLHTTYVGMYMVNGASVIYFGQKTFLITSDSFYVSLCMCFLPLISIGVTLLFGTLLVKTWRLYKIFVHYMDPGKYLSNIYLTMFVACLTLVDVAICLLWFVIDPIHREQFEVSRDHREGKKIVQAVCESKAYAEMLGLMILYQGVIVGMTMYLVFKLRKNIPQRHKNLRSASIVRLSFIMAFGVSFVVPGYVLSHYYLKAIEFEYAMLGILLDSLQLFFIILFLIPPLRPILARKFLLVITKCQNLSGKNHT